MALASSLHVLAAFRFCAAFIGHLWEMEMQKNTSTYRAVEKRKNEQRRVIFHKLLVLTYNVFTNHALPWFAWATSVRSALQFGSSLKTGACCASPLKAQETNKYICGVRSLRCFVRIALGDTSESSAAVYAWALICDLSGIRSFRYLVQDDGNPC
jgi:hypothetical protein